MFQIPDEVQKQKDALVKECEDDVVAVRCNNCGAHTVMNKRYAAILKNGIDSCGQCRNKT